MHFQSQVQLAALAVAATTVGALPLNIGAGESADIPLPQGNNIQETGGASLTIDKRIYLPPGSAPIGDPTLPNGIHPQILEASSSNNKRAPTTTATGEEIQGSIGPISGDLKIGPNGEVTGQLDTPLGDASGSVHLRRAIIDGANGGVIIDGGANAGIHHPEPLKRDGISGGADVKSPLGDIEGQLGINKRVEPPLSGGIGVDSLPLNANGHIQIPKRTAPDVGADLSVTAPYIDADGKLQLSKRLNVGGSGSVNTPIVDGGAHGGVHLPILPERDIIDGSADVKSGLGNVEGSLGINKRAEPGLNAGATVDSPIVDANGGIHIAKRSEPIVAGSADADVKQFVDADGNIHLGKRIDIGGSGSVDTPIVDGGANGGVHLPILSEREIINGNAVLHPGLGIPDATATLGVN